MPEQALPHDHHEGPELPILRQTLNDLPHFQLVAEVFKQLGDPTRVRLFWLLCHHEECVINLSAMRGMSGPAISHHLRPLRNAGLVTTRREGKEVYYHAADTRQAQLLHHMIEQVMEITCPD